MKKFLSVAGAAVMLLVGAAPVHADGNAIRYTYNTDWDEYVEFFGPDGNFTVYPWRQGARCGGDNWGGFLANLGRDTSDVIFIKTESCERNIKVCVDVEDLGSVFRPQVCATLGWHPGAR